jgi:2-oxoglutarate ferredoxin oxidoreductase subunit gamma
MIASAAMTEGLEASWLPSYGSEMRGGTANCNVIVSNTPIASPTLRSANFIAVLNRPSLIKFENWVEKGGNLVINSSLIEDKSARDNINLFYIPANDIATEAGNARGMNMVILGAYIAVAGSLGFDSVFEAIDETFSGNKAKYAASNKELVKKGYEYIKANY